MLPYLTICSVLYHIAFWGTFNLNGLLYISVSDILKSAAQPIALVFISSVVTLVIVFYVFGFGKLYPIGGGRDTKLGKKLNSNIGQYLSILALAVFIFLTYYLRKDPWRWTELGLFTALPISIFLFNKSFLLSEIPNIQLRYFVIQYVVYLPLLSFATGKKESELIYQNIRYKYTIASPSNQPKTIVTDTLKFIGATSQKIFFTDLKNTATIILNSDIDTLILAEKK